MKLHLNEKEYYKLQEFLFFYSDEYPVMASRFLEQKFSSQEIDATVDVVLQILDMLDLLPKDKNIYIGFLNYIKQYFTLDKDILEVGCGFLPSLARHIDKEQRLLHKGTITCYDNNLILDQFSNICLKKENFTLETTGNYDYVIGLAPCEATETIIRWANQHNKEFSIALCGCTHFSKNMLLSGWIPTSESWTNYVYNIASSTKETGSEIILDYPDKKYDFPGAVITKKRK